MNDPEDQTQDSKDLKKLSKGQLKKLKDKAKKEGKAEGDVAAEPEPTTTTETNGSTQNPADDNLVEATQDDTKETEDAGKDEGKKELTKGQLKKLKEKAKKEGKPEPQQAAPAQAAKIEEKKDEEEAESKDDKKDKKDKKGAKKPMNAAAKLAQQRLEEKKKLEEEQKKIEEELRRQEEEERRKQEEEERKVKEEEERRRKEKEDKIKKLKEEGVYKSKKEREREAALIRRREELIAQGIISADQFEDHGDKPKSKAVRTKKPKQKKDSMEQHTETQDDDNKEETKEQHEETEETEKKEEEPATWEDEFESTKDTAKKADLEDWETFGEADTTKKVTEDKKVKAPKAEDKVPEKPKEKIEKIEKKADIVEDKPKKVEETTVKATPREEPSKKDDKKAETPAKEEPKKADKKAETQPKEENKSPEKDKKSKAKITEESKQADNTQPLRSPIVCILGHVDTGKTSLLDKMRNTNVQEGEAGGITQQIGATFFPREKLHEELEKCQTCYPVELQVPGLLVIDTPGHESFSNLRSRGSGLCDIAILVVDIMHGLEKQTLESIELLRFRKTPFVIALNKVDRIYGWKPHPNSSSYLSLKKQDKNAQLEFRDRSKGIITELTEKGFNVALYYDNPDPNTYVSLIPTSAVTGEGISDLTSVAVNLTQKWLRKKISVKSDFKCTVLEVKVIEGLGASIDVMLVDGTLNEGDKIIIAGYDGVIVTHVRALLTPHPMKEMRVKNEYIHHKSIKGAMGIKISGTDLDKALAGSELYVVKKEGDEELYKHQLEEEIRKVKKSIKLVDEGVLVASSTLGSLEALLQFLKSSKIPVSNISIGPISKAEVIKAMKPLQITEGEIKIEYATILAFDVKVFPDAKDLAEQEGVKIFTANIIYHLFDQFTAYLRDLQEERKRNEGKLAVFPAILKPVAFFNMKDPIVMGLDVVEGQLRLGTPICVLEKGKLKIGTIESMEKEHKPLQVARPSDGSIAVKIKGDSTIMAGRHFELKDRLISIVSRESIDALKKYFRDEMSKTDWELIKKMKPLFNII